MTFLEIACFNTESALIANDAGADRIELCQHAEVGGTTPLLASLHEIRDQISIPVFVMIRPRGGDFVYSDDEFNQMKTSIAEFKSAADGFVFGLLDGESNVDANRVSELVALAHPLPCTFHRAFDQAADLSEALESVITCGMSTVLTSGGAPSAKEGCDTLATLVDTAQGGITIMPGGGIRSSNLHELMARTNATSYHSSALIEGDTVASFSEIQRLKQELQRKKQ